MKSVKAKHAFPEQETLLKQLRTALPQLQERYGVRTLALFGSYARKSYNRRSDLDLLVEFDERPLTLLQFIALEQELSDLLEMKVDLVEKRALKPAIGKQILEELTPI